MKILFIFSFILLFGDKVAYAGFNYFYASSLFYQGNGVQIKKQRGNGGDERRGVGEFIIELPVI